ncbi:MAG: hypothetical protein WCQ95_01370 [Bacteroidota bacterium]
MRSANQNISQPAVGLTPLFMPTHKQACHPVQSRKDARLVGSVRLHYLVAYGKHSPLRPLLYSEF